MGLRDRGDPGDGSPGCAINVMIAHPELPGQFAIRAILDAGDRVRVVALTSNGAQAIAAVQRQRPTVTLLDDRLSAPEGCGLVEELARRTRVIMLTSATDPQVLTALLHGPALGYLVYNHFEPVDVLGAVCAVADGLGWLSPVVASVATAALRTVATPTEPVAIDADRLRRDWLELRLTVRERDVLALLCEGRSNPAIAAALSITEKTVKNHLNRSFAKLGVRNRNEAVQRLTRQVGAAVL